MNSRELGPEFITVFAITLVTVVIVTWLWNITRRGASTVDWDTAFLYAIPFGIIQTWENGGKPFRNSKLWNPAPIFHLAPCLPQGPSTSVLPGRSHGL